MRKTSTRNMLLYFPTISFILPSPPPIRPSEMEAKNHIFQGIKNLGVTSLIVLICYCLLQWGPRYFDFGMAVMPHRPNIDLHCKVLGRHPASASSLPRDCIRVLRLILKEGQIKSQASVASSLYMRFSDLQKIMARYHSPPLTFDSVFYLAEQSGEKVSIQNYAKALQSLLYHYRDVLETIGQHDPLIKKLLHPYYFKLLKLIRNLAPEQLRMTLKLSPKEDPKTLMAIQQRQIFFSKFITTTNAMTSEIEILFQTPTPIATRFSLREIQKNPKSPGYQFAMAYEGALQKALKKLEDHIVLHPNQHVSKFSLKYHGLVPHKIKVDNFKELKNYIKRRLEDKEFDLVRKNADGSYTLIEVKSYGRGRKQTAETIKALRMDINKEDKKIKNKSKHILHSLMRRKRRWADEVYQQAKLSTNIVKFLFGPRAPIQLETVFLHTEIPKQLRKKLEKIGHTVTVVIPTQE